MHIKTTAFVALLLLTACQAQSDIQAKYIGQQSDCRDTAEERMDALPNLDNLSARQRNAALVDQFSNCMIKEGWHVARPVKNPVVPTPPGTTKTAVEANLPAQPLPGQPSNVITTAAPVQQVPQQSSPPGAPVKTQTSPLQPSPSTPALNNPATPASNYQPRTTAPAQAVPPNGQNLGRQF